MHPARGWKITLCHSSRAALLSLLFTFLLFFALRSLLHAAPMQTGTITGQVSAGGSGAPLAGIEITAFPREVAGGQLVATTTTDHSGNYELSALQGGTYQICFVDRNVDPRFLGECYDNKSPQDEEQLVTVVEGDTLANINAALALGGMIQGRIISELTGEPLAGIRVDVGGVTLPYSSIFYSDASGFYTATALPTDHYLLSFNSTERNESYAAEYYNNKQAPEASDPVTVTAGMTTTAIDAALSFILNITGRVVQANSGKPIEGITVGAYDAAGGLQALFCCTDATGLYTITSLAPGPYRIRFDQNIFVNEYYSNRPTFEEADWITVTNGVVLEGINASLTLRQGSDLRLASASTRPDVLLATQETWLGFTPLFTLDGGQSWHPFVSQPLANGSIPQQIAVVPKDDAAQPVRFLVAYGSNAEAIYRSGDEGASWATFTPPTDPRCNPGQASVINALVASPADPQRLYALTRCFKTETQIEPVHFSYWSLFASSDGGVNWQAVDVPLTENGTFGDPFGRVEESFLPSPVEPARIYSRLETSTSDIVWRRSDNGGQDWITDTFTLTLVAPDWVNANKLYGIEDVGDEFPTENVFRYTGKRSNNMGATWEPWAQQPCRTSFRQLIALPDADSLMLLCNQGLYRSNNGGDSWTFLTAESSGTLWPHSGDRDLVLWVRGTKLYGSRDQGTTWSYLGIWQENVFLPSVRHTID